MRRADRLARARMAGDARRLGIYGFGAAAHIVAQVARHQGRRGVRLHPRGRPAAQDFARELGAVWAGSSAERPPEELDAALIFAPVGALIRRRCKRSPRAAWWSRAAST